MNVEEFESAAKRDIKSFCRWWKRQHKLNPEQFPLELDEPAVWREMFDVWAGLSFRKNDHD